MKVAIITDQHFGARKNSLDGSNYSDYNSIKDAVHSKVRNN